LVSIVGFRLGLSLSSDIEVKGGGQKDRDHKKMTFFDLGQLLVMMRSLRVSDTSIFSDNVR